MDTGDKCRQSGPLGDKSTGCDEWGCIANGGMCLQRHEHVPPMDELPAMCIKTTLHAMAPLLYPCRRYPKCPWGLYASPPLVAMAVVGWFLCFPAFFFWKKGGVSICDLRQKKKVYLTSTTRERILTAALLPPICHQPMCTESRSCGGGGGQAMMNCRSLLIRRHSRNLSESRTRAVQCYDCPTTRCGSSHYTFWVGRHLCHLRRLGGGGGGLTPKEGGGIRLNDHHPRPPLRMLGGPSPLGRIRPNPCGSGMFGFKPWSLLLLLYCFRPASSSMHRDKSLFCTHCLSFAFCRVLTCFSKAWSV